MAAKRIAYVESEDVTHHWTDSFSKAAEKYLKENVGPARSYMRMGRFSVIVSKEGDIVIAGEAYPDDGPRLDGLFSFDRMGQCAKVVKALWKLDREGRRHPLHDELMDDIEKEALGWTKPDLSRKH
jgi:hypothetical protein